MKRFLGFAVMAAILLATSMVAKAQDVNQKMTENPVHFTINVGGGTGGLGTSNSKYSYMYGMGDLLYTPSALHGFGFIGRGGYFLNSAASNGTRLSTGALDNGISTGRGQLGFAYLLYDEETEWWIYSDVMFGTDYEQGKGFLHGGVLSGDLSFGQGFFTNELNATLRLGDEADRSYWVRDRMYFRLTRWLAVGPEVSYTWFQQWNEKDQELKMVYEPSFGGQIKFTENSDDPRFGLIVDGSNGSWVGTSWGVSLFYRF